MRFSEDWMPAFAGMTRKNAWLKLETKSIRAGSPYL
jgi:hypothetical protein